MSAPSDAIGTESMAPIPRQYDLDWLRVLVVLFVFWFHVSLIFQGGWIVENGETSTALRALFGMSDFLRMPVLFFVAGAGTWLAFRRRSGNEYIRERSRRLLLPLAVGLFALLPIQFYFSVRFHAGERLSILELWPAFLDGLFPYINEGWSHLWFIAYLFIFSVICTPMFLLLRSATGARLLARALGVLKRPFAIFTLVAPLMMLEWALYWNWPQNRALLGDWASVLVFITLFLYGFVLFSSQAFWNAVDRHMTHAAGLAVVVAPLLALARLNPGDVAFHIGTLDYLIFVVLRSLILWCSLIAILGFARKYLAWENGVLRYSRDAAYPFYVIHHPIVIAVGFVVVTWDLNLYAKFVVVGLTALALTLVAYEVAVRRFTPMRLAFGMKALPEATSGGRHRRSVSVWRGGRYVSTTVDLESPSRFAGQSGTYRLSVLLVERRIANER